MTSKAEHNRHDQKPSLSLSHLGDEAMAQRIAELIQMQTGDRWDILHLTRYEQHWVAVGFQGGLVRDFLFEQTLDAQLIYHVAEKTIYPLTKSLWRYSTRTNESLELTTYVVQYGGEQCNECTITTAFTQASLHHYLMNEHDLGTDVVLTCFYGEREEGEGRYHKHLDGTFTVVYEEGLSGLLQELQLPQNELGEKNA